MMEVEKTEVNERSEEQRKDRLGDEIWGGRILLHLLSSSHIILFKKAQMFLKNILMRLRGRNVFESLEMRSCLSDR